MCTSTELQLQPPDVLGGLSVRHADGFQVTVVNRRLHKVAPFVRPFLGIDECNHDLSPSPNFTGIRFAAPPEAPVDSDSITTSFSC